MLQWFDEKPVSYLNGYGGYYSSEALLGALPADQNSPQYCPYGLYAEQISGTAFTAPRYKNLKTWTYRIRPSAVHAAFEPCLNQSIDVNFSNLIVNPNQMRWMPPPSTSGKSETLTFVEGLNLKCGAGEPSLKEGLAIYDYFVNKSMGNSAFYSADGDFLIVPQEGTLFIKTELGRMTVSPGEIVVIPRGIKFTVDVQNISNGYVLEVFCGHFELPNLGPIGANGLANPRDFEVPSACFEDESCEYLIFLKFSNKLFCATADNSPYDVVAWHGNYVPYKYHLKKFNCINTVSFDHPDPSIYTVLSCPSSEIGVSAVDFVIFPPRWIVAEHTFRPPYYHRNVMSEFMGMIYGKYDAKVSDVEQMQGFLPGGSSLHNCMMPHGPDAATFKKATNSGKLVPVYYDEGLAFMFETKYILKVSPSAMNETVDKNYTECWKHLPKLFNGELNPSDRNEQS